jgi:hypothetical protein
MRSLGWKKQAFLVCLVLIAGAALSANLVQSDSGAIDVKVIRIVDKSGLLVSGNLKTGRIYLGTISAIILTVWVMAASSMLI